MRERWSWLGVLVLSSLAWSCEGPEHAHSEEETHQAPAAHHEHAAPAEEGAAPAGHHEEAHAHHADEHAHHAGGSARTLGRAEGPAADAVRAEMQALRSAILSMVTDVADGQLDALPERLAPVHEARQATVAAVEAHGYRPPGAPDDLAGFEAADDAFHESLVGLLNAAREDDLPEATRQLGAVLSGCTSCHEQYRFVEETP